MATAISTWVAISTWLRNTGVDDSRAARRRRQAVIWSAVVILSSLITHQASCLCAAEPELRAPRLLLAWGNQGTEPGEFYFPIGIAISPADEILITDHYNNRVQRFDRNGKFLGQFGVLPNPGGIALDKVGNVYLSHFPTSVLTKDIYPDRVTVYSATGAMLHEWGKTGNAPGEFSYPGGLAITQDGHVYVADQTNHRMQVLDSNGRFLATWGKYGTKPGEFGGNSHVKSRAGGPDFVALDKQGNVYTTEAMDGRVQKFSAEGVFVLAFGDLKDQPGSFGREFEPLHSMHGPLAICCDSKDRLWISAAGGRIQQFTNEGHYLRGFGEQQGSELGQFLAPHGVAIDSRGHLYVVDAYNHRIQKFDVGQL